jgi:ferredoxin
MPKLTIAGSGTYDVEDGRRLVKAIKGCGVDIGHRCGGKAKCTTCRVEFSEGEPGQMTRAEYDKLMERELLGEVRLSCQIVCDHDMAVKARMLQSEMGWSDPGPEPEDDVMPEARWFPKEDLVGK